MISLNTLLQKMEAGEIVEKIHMDPEEIDAVLKKRDDATFSAHWMNLFELVNDKKAALGLALDAGARVARLRELSFLQSYNIWNSPELSAYISDDFGLIGDSLAIGFADPRLDLLAAMYLSGHFPCDAPP